MHIKTQRNELDLDGEYKNQNKQKFNSRFCIDEHILRSFISVCYDRNVPMYRWYKYKAGFSSSFVKHSLNLYQIICGRVLDSFAGCRTTLFAAKDIGLYADGIELLPLGQEIIEGKK
ncbi:MAG: hypothetical protein NZM04_00185 [Methylacidiphilales bacterium]|nr:hypothetical protein [Candidatus Methylacidiphilales bacterium]